MDRLSTLLSLFSPHANQVKVLQKNKHITDSSWIGFVYEGEATLSIKEQPDTLLQCNDLIWVTSDYPQQLTLIEPTTTLLCCPLDFDNNNPLLELLPTVITIAEKEIETSALKPVIELLLKENLHKRCGQAMVVNRLVEVLLVHLLRFLMENKKIEKGVIAGLSDIRLARAMTAIHEQPQQHWSVASLAQTAGMSRTAFNEHFRNTIGYPPGEYLSRWRMRLACNLLQDHQSSISQISDQLGYQSETAFFRAFRREIGMTPRQYQQQTSMIF